MTSPKIQQVLDSIPAVDPNQEHNLLTILVAHTDAMCAISDPNITAWHTFTRLLDCVEEAAVWLTALGIKDWRATMLTEWEHAHSKHPTMTLDQAAPTLEQRVACITEEVGEIARALTYDKDHAGNLAEEITQWGALCAAQATHPLAEFEGSHEQ